MPDVKAYNPLCATCHHVRSAHDFDRKGRHMRCTVATDKDGECDCREFRFREDKP